MSVVRHFSLQILPQNLIIFTILTFPLFTCGQNYLASSLLPAGYDKTLTPAIDDAPLPVEASIKINSFTVNERAQTITADIYLCMNWTDFRLQDNDEDVVKLTSFANFWTPSVNFRNALSAAPIVTLTRIEYMQIIPANRSVNYCSRMSVEFICILQLPNFPFDEQYCQFQLENFDITRQDLHLSMKSIPGTRGSNKFRLRNTYTGNCDPISDNYVARLHTWSSDLGTKNCAVLTVRLVRSINYYIIRYFAPTFFCVMICFTQFWMPTNAWPARIILTATNMMTVITISLNGYNEVPSNDVTALAWWFWFCQFFIFMSMVAYALSMAWTYFVADKKAARAANKPSPDGRYFGKKSWYWAVGPSIGNFIRFFFGPIDHFRDPMARSKVDYFCRIFFPTAWIFYTLLYIVSTLPIWTTKFYV